MRGERTEIYAELQRTIQNLGGDKGGAKRLVRPLVWRPGVPCATNMETGPRGLTMATAATWLPLSLVSSLGKEAEYL